jgi:hypothetical protein
MPTVVQPKPPSWNDIKSRALTFAKKWSDATSEDSEAKPFWIDFLDLFGIPDKRVATFEHSVKMLTARRDNATGYVDLFWPGMLLVEHKSRGKDLDEAMHQAFGYLQGIADHQLPKLIVVCDFARFRLHWLKTGETAEFTLSDLHSNIRHFGFLVGYRTQRIEPQNPVNLQAAERMGRLHDRLKASGYSGHALELLLVRLLFCLFADDTGIFQPARAFHAFLEERTQPDGSDTGPMLARLFQLLNTPEDRRSAQLDEALLAFPYVNGRLFGETTAIADFDRDTRAALLDACALDWAAISPAIFGSLFQSIMDDKARRNLGAHYTSEANILKVIGPLFLDSLRDELVRSQRSRERLLALQRRLRQLTFLDPACGCGNFLVISYRELRLLELDLLRAVAKIEGREGQQVLDVSQLLSIDVHQFYGIEIEEFPAQIAQVALWLVDHQMNLKVSEEFGQYVARIPLTSSPTIKHGNALRFDWNTLLPADRCSYVLGNPPFVGAKYMSDEQRADTRKVFGDIENAGLLDLVAAWYVLAARYSAGNPDVTCAFVSTNSIVQGEQVGALWGWMLAQGVSIHFAHRTFSWSNEATGNAAVHCVIVGFGRRSTHQKTIFEYADIKGEPLAMVVDNINPYLVDAPDLVLPRRRKPLCNVPEIGIGNKPIDGGNYLFTTTERDAFIDREPSSARWFRRWLGADEFLNGYERWCLWVGDCSPQELRMMPAVLERIQAVREFRMRSKSLPTQRLANTPTRFHVEVMPERQYLVIPEVSSERRDYLPIGFVTAPTMCSNLVKIVDGATHYHLGILTSKMHNAWIRYTCGRLKSDYRYSKDIVYNNYPWPEVSADNISAIKSSAQAVLEVRASYQRGEQPASLADLYDPLTMPAELLTAHRTLDGVVDSAYLTTARNLLGQEAPTGWKNDADRVAFLFRLYQHYTATQAENTGARRAHRSSRDTTIA